MGLLLADVVCGPEEIADLAGLHHVDRQMPGLVRRRCGRGFTYVDTDGATVKGEARERIESLAIPPAWTEVWICPDPEGHLQATGCDDAGRTQYRYHDRFRAEAERVKYLRLGPFGLALDGIRRQVAKHLHQPPRSERRVTASVVRLIDQGLLRVGWDDPDDDESGFGATTLRREHLQVDGNALELDFPGKSGGRQQRTLHDRWLVHVVKECLEIPGDCVFQYVGDHDEPAPVTADTVNRYLNEVSGQQFTAKDFRTWGGTVVVAEELARASDRGDREADAQSAIVAACDAAADRLGNSRAVCRASYVSPTVVEAFETGELEATWRRTRSGKWSSRPERTVARIHDRVDVASLRRSA